MTNELHEKLAKIYALIDRGSTEGEKAAARAALDRIVAKHGIDEAKLDDLTKKEMSFTYVSMMEQQLLFILLEKFAPDHTQLQRRTYGAKTIYTSIDYLQAVTVECAYEYFRRHMKSEWIRTCAPLVSRCRTTKGANKRRKKLQGKFMATYFLRSGLIEEKDVTITENRSKEDFEQSERLQGVQGGQYHKQAQSGHLLNE